MIIHELIEEQFKSMEASERMKECLQLRMKLLRVDYANKTSYDKNEIEITEMKTEAQIDALIKVIFDKKELFYESFGRYMEELQFEELKKENLV